MNGEQLQKNIRCIALSIIFIMPLLIGCSSKGMVIQPSEEVKAPTNKEATLEIPTETAIPTDTPVPPTETPKPTDTLLPPTRTPVPTATPYLTATSFRVRDPKAMIAWKELGLPANFEAFSPEAIGMEEGAIAFTYGKKSYKISGSFLFANGGNISTQRVYGYTVSLPTESDRQVFDGLIDSVEDYGGASGMKVLEDSTDIGNHSKGATGKLDDNDDFTVICFRIDDIGACVFLRHKPTVKSGINPLQVARVYAKSIDESTSYCKITSVKPVQNSSIPTFRIKAEGFYPKEERYIDLYYEINGLKFSFSALGGGGKTVAQDGSLSEEFSIYVQKAQLPEGPIEFTVTVGGYISNCEATQTVNWP
jgi:hypothetical protein